MGSSYAELEADVYYLAGQKGQFENALRRIAAFEAEASTTDRLRAHFLRASILLTVGNVAEAVPLYQEVLDNLQGDPRLQSMACVELLYAVQITGDFALGKRVAQQFSDLNEHAPDATALSVERISVLQGTLLQLQGEHTAAMENFKRALRQLEDPDLAAVPRTDRTFGIAFCWYGMALSYIALDDPVKARFAINGIRSDPRSTTMQALVAMAEFYLELHLGHLDRAEKCLKEAEEHNADPDRAQEILLGRARVAHRRHDAAALASSVEQLRAQPYLTYAVRHGLADLGVVDG